MMHVYRARNPDNLAAAQKHLGQNRKGLRVAFFPTSGTAKPKIKFRKDSQGKLSPYVFEKRAKGHVHQFGIHISREILDDEGMLRDEIADIFGSGPKKARYKIWYQDRVSQRSYLASQPGSILTRFAMLRQKYSAAQAEFNAIEKALIEGATPIEAARLGAMARARVDESGFILGVARFEFKNQASAARYDEARRKHRIKIKKSRGKR